MSSSSASAAWAAPPATRSPSAARSVLGLEQFDIPHAYGSSHGETRIIRLAYAEGAFYVPLLRRAYERWQRLEHDFGEQLCCTSPAGWISARPIPPSSAVRAASCREHDLSHELLTATETMARFPALQLPPHFVANYQAEGGFLRSERCIVAHVTRAQALGAEIHAREAVLSWEARGDSVHVQTTKGELCGRPPGRHRWRLGRAAATGAGGARATGTPVPGLVPAAGSAAFRQGAPARLAALGRGRRGQLVRLPGAWHPRLQAGQVPPSGRADGPQRRSRGDRRPRSQRGRRGAVAALHGEAISRAPPARRWR